MVSLKKNWQGVISMIKELKMSPFIVDVNKPFASGSFFTLEEIAEIQHHIARGTSHVYDPIKENETVKKNTREF